MESIIKRLFVGAVTVFVMIVLIVLFGDGRTLSGAAAVTELPSAKTIEEVYGQAGELFNSDAKYDVRKIEKNIDKRSLENLEENPSDKTSTGQLFVNKNELDIGAMYEEFIDAVWFENGIYTNVTPIVQWSSSDEKVACVTRGKISTKKEGEAVVTAKYGELKQNIIVRVSRDGEKTAVGDTQTNSSDASATLSGWREDGADWYYSDGEKNVTGWKEIEGRWYYFREDGVMLSGWQELDDKWYYFGSNGLLDGGWQQIDGKDYYISDSGEVLTGWQEVDGKWYYFKENVEMLKGWQNIGEKWYYFGDDGAMLKGWQQIGMEQYYLHSDGNMAAREWTSDSDGNWYYLRGSGRMSAHEWIEVSGNTYYTHSSGRVGRNEWINWSDGNWYYLKDDGVMAVNTSLDIGGASYSFDENGVCTNPN